MLRSRSRSLRLISGIEVSAFLSVLLALTAFFASPAMSPMFSPPTGPPVDQVHVKHAATMPHADRVDAIWITVDRSGSVWVGNKRVVFSQITEQINLRLAQGSERKIYLNVDQRARCGAVWAVLDEVRSSGVEDIAFLVVP
jgi:biopolymer transport protein ExbD